MLTVTRSASNLKEKIEMTGVISMLMPVICMFSSQEDMSRVLSSHRHEGKDMTGMDGFNIQGILFNVIKVN